MKNIVLIGNGFDLSHDLKTDYKSFIYNLFREKDLNRGKHKDLFKYYTPVNIYNDYDEYHSEIKSLNKEILANDPFFIKIIEEFETKNWCDIEKEYYDSLCDINNPKNLNKCFESIKNKLEEYLTKQISFESKIKSYSTLFEKLNSYNTTIINFNYTPTINKLYQDETKNCNLLNIHGELNNDKNPIIFGFAPNNEENKKLLVENNVDHLKNIKTYNYKRNNIERQINELIENPMNKREGIDVIVLGHSCSISDKNILKRIFTNDQVQDINIFYHNNFASYFNTLTGIHRVMESNTNYSKIRDFESAFRTPQLSDDNDLEQKFISKLNQL